MEVSILKKAEPSDFEAIKNLSLLLHSKLSPDQVHFEELEQLISDDTAVTFVAREDGRIVGMAILFILARVGDLSGYVDNVIVDDRQRGKGIATLLMQKLIDTAKERGLKRLELTSRASREAANHLYQKLGFVIRETNPYRLDL